MGVPEIVVCDCCAQQLRASRRWVQTITRLTNVYENDIFHPSPNMASQATLPLFEYNGRKLATSTFRLVLSLVTLSWWMDGVVEGDPVWHRPVGPS